MAKFKKIISKLEIKKKPFRKAKFQKIILKWQNLKIDILNSKIKQV